MRVRQIVNLSSFISFIELCVVNRERFLLAQCISCEGWVCYGLFRAFGIHLHSIFFNVFP